MGKELLTGSGSDGAVVGAFGVAGFGGAGGVGVDEEGGDWRAQLGTYYILHKLDWDGLVSVLAFSNYEQGSVRHPRFSTRASTTHLFRPTTLLEGL